MVNYKVCNQNPDVKKGLPKFSTTGLS